MPASDNAVLAPVLSNRALEAIGQRCRQATAGPWRVEQYDDAAFIAHAREDVLVLVAAVRSVREFVERLVAAPRMHYDQISGELDSLLNEAVRETDRW